MVRQKEQAVSGHGPGLCLTFPWDCENRPANTDIPGSFPTCFGSGPEMLNSDNGCSFLCFVTLNLLFCLFFFLLFLRAQSIPLFLSNT